MFPEHGSLDMNGLEEYIADGPDELLTAGINVSAKTG
jgi:hypothetical protein